MSTSPQGTQNIASRRAAPKLPWALLALTIILGGIGILFLLVNQEGPAREPIESLYGDVLYILGGTVTATIGALIAARRRRNPIGWLLLGAALVQVAQDASEGYAVYTLISPHGILPGALFFAWLSQWLWAVIPAVAMLVLLLYPTGHLLSRRWRIVAWAGIGGVAAFVLALALSSELYVGGGQPPLLLANPIGVFDAKNIILSIILPLSSAFQSIILFASLISLVIRFRGAQGDERQQLKWFTYATAVAVAIQPFAVALLGNWSQIVTNIAFTMLPLAIGVAILKYRLYEIDLLINRTLVYVPLTAILAGIFAASITLSQKLFIAITGGTSDAATVLTTLIVVAAFTPVKDWLQARVDKRFKEPADPAKKLRAFAAQLRGRTWAVDPRQVSRRLLEEAVGAFEAKGGAAYLDADAQTGPFQTYGEWDGDAKLSAPLEINGARFGSVSLGARRNGADYTDRDKEALQHTATVVAQAIEVDYDAGDANREAKP